MCRQRLLVAVRRSTDQVGVEDRCSSIPKILAVSQLPTAVRASECE